jgi:mannonate dehydratase
LRLSVVEGHLPMEPIVLGSSSRDQKIDELCAFVRHMGALGAEILCYNFMPLFDWSRTSFQTPGRGGALVSSFDEQKLQGKQAPNGQQLERGQLWDNLAYFLEKIIPVAEDAGVVLAMHPDDPPLASFMGANQIMYEVESFERLVELVPSPANGICFCQGTFAEMSVDIPATIQRLGQHICYVHFRDVRGEARNFVETFHDEGQTDMAEAMRAYHAIGFMGPMRPDHVPQLHDETGEPGYTMLGRLFAVGYMRGVMHGIGVR